MTLTRRQALAAVIGAGASAAAAGPASACPSAGGAGASDPVAMLYDTTRCIGCKACVTACTRANGLEPDTTFSGGLYHMPPDLNSRTKNIIKLFTDERTGQHSFVKRQCMHCADPSCVAGCPFHALHKDPVTGIVGWDGWLCIGCRYCEVVCPFEIPKFEWDEFNPRVVKCEFCRHLLGSQADEPACTAACPTEAVVFGRREPLLAEAADRVRANPGRYHANRVYGEHEAGGTQVLYLSHVPFERIGLPELAAVSLPENANRYQRLIYQWMALPVAVYTVMVTVIRKRWRKHDEEAMAIERAGGPRDQI